MTRDELLNLYGKFYWSFSQEFFIETSKGNFVWSDPDYDGTNRIKRFNGKYGDWISQLGIPYARSKGAHLISGYCGPDIVFSEQNT
jgi:hypothetical protein